MDKKYTCRLGEVRNKREEATNITSELPDDIRAQVLIMYTLEEISDTLAIKRKNCEEKYTTEECLGFIRSQFELDYKDYLAESEG